MQEGVMNCETSTRTVLVPLPISFVEALLHMRFELDDGLGSVLSESVGSTTLSSSDRPKLDVIAPARGKHAAEFLGIAFSAKTLAALFGQVIDITAVVAPEA